MAGKTKTNANSGKVTFGAKRTGKAKKKYGPRAEKPKKYKKTYNVFLYICIMAKSKVISVPMSNHQKLVEMGNLIKDKKAKRLYFCMDEFYFEVSNETTPTKKK